MDKRQVNTMPYFQGTACFRDGLKPRSQLSIHHQISHSMFTKLQAFIFDLFPSQLCPPEIKYFIYLNVYFTYCSIVNAFHRWVEKKKERKKKAASWFLGTAFLNFTGRGCGVSLSGDIQDPPRRGPVQPAVGDPASAGGLDWMTHKGPFQPQTFCDSVTAMNCQLLRINLLFLYEPLFGQLPIILPRVLMTNLVI